MKKYNTISVVRIIVLIAALLISRTVDAQFSGGSRHGIAVSFFSAVNNSDTVAFRGASGDGSGYMLLTRVVIWDTIASAGGGGDGIGQAVYYRTASSDDFAFRGGGGDGITDEIFTRAVPGDMVAFAGGTGDGSALSASPVIYVTDTVAAKGGRGRGEMSVTALRYSCGVAGLVSVWNGSRSTVWSDAGNWNCGNVPSASSTVIIPSGLLRYPKVFSAAEIRSLQMMNGSSVIVLQGISFIINGQ